jgi:hypothetical protein
MLAKDLKELVKKQGSVTIRVIAQPSEEENISDYGASVAGIFTYLRTGMMADITDACSMPNIHKGLDSAAYREAMEQGYVYFVFHHEPYLTDNEKVADDTWTNDSPPAGKLPKGTAMQIGTYTGYDMVGFPPDDDMFRLFEIVEKA